MALRRKQEEKSLQQLRELAAQTHNKQCLDCGQRGPTYVNMTIGSFVCTSCSGRLRGLTPPNRVKSISMASFSAEEIEFIKQRGNEWCKAVWLGLHDASRHADIDPKDDQQIKDFMVLKYEKKRYYVDPSVAFKDQPAAAAGPPDPAGSPPAPCPAAAAVPGPSPAIKPLSKLAGCPVKPITLSQNVTLPGPTRAAEQKYVDLLAELSPVTSAAQADPFSPSSDTGGGDGGGRTVEPSAAVGANFANFANFDALNASAAQPGGRQPTGSAPPAATATGPAPASFANFSSQAAVLSSVPLPAGATPGSGVVARSAGDRYAALKELDEVLKAEVEPVTVDWGAGPREPAAPQSQGWAAFGAVTNGVGPYGHSPQQGLFGQSAQQAAYGQSAQQAAYGSAQQPAYGQSPQQPAYGQSPQQPAYGQSAQQPAYGQSAQQTAYGQSPQQTGFAGGQFAAAASACNGLATDMGTPVFGVANGSSAPRGAGPWAASGTPTGWGAASANPFTSANGGPQHANPHNPFL